MKKSITLTLSIILLFILVGCNNSGAKTVNSEKSSDSQNAQITTPNILSLNKDSAKENLEKLGFSVELQEAPEYDNTIADGNVVEQSLNEGTVVIKGTKIVLSYNSARFRWVYHLGDDESTKELAYLYDCQGEYNEASIEIPAQIDGYKITQWTLSNSLEKYNSIKTIYLPKDIDSNKFYHDTLTWKNKGIEVITQ